VVRSAVARRLLGVAIGREGHDMKKRANGQRKARRTRTTKTTTRESASVTSAKAKEAANALFAMFTDKEIAQIRNHFEQP
jgi:hypothetical protein